MTIVKRNGSLFPSLFHNFFENEWNPGTGISTSFANQPKVNIQESEKGFKIELATPGIKKDDINISIENNVLEISASISGEVKEEVTSNYMQREFFSTSFKQTFSLSDEINQEKIEADYKDGVLKLTLPKKEAEKKKLLQRIKIK